MENPSKKIKREIKYISPPMVLIDKCSADELYCSLRFFLLCGKPITFQLYVLSEISLSIASDLSHWER